MLRQVQMACRRPEDCQPQNKHQAFGRDQHLALEPLWGRLILLRGRLILLSQCVHLVLFPTYPQWHLQENLADL